MILLPFKPNKPGERPTLGWYVLDWMMAHLATPALPYYRQFIPYREQADFILKFYELDDTGRRFAYYRALLGRPRGWGKSPLLSALAITEALADVVPDGFDADGQPVGRPWWHTARPDVWICAASEDQAKRNSWTPLLEMATNGPLMDYYDIEPRTNSIILPAGFGEITYLAASARSSKGTPGVFAVLDQTETWTSSNGGLGLYNVVSDNVGKVGGRWIESPNAFIPGDGSVAEKSAETAELIALGQAPDDGLLYDMREAPADTDLDDVDSLREGLRYVYGCASADPRGCVLHDPPCPPGHMHLEVPIRKIIDPMSDRQEQRANWLNQITHASDSWVTKPWWDACMDISKRILPTDKVVLGFDGSRGRERGKADATALIGCRVSDGHVWEIRVWEPPTGPQARHWTTPEDEVEATVAACMEHLNVIGLYADPSGWSTNVAGWQARWGHRMQVRSSATQPMVVWPRASGIRVVDAVERTRMAIATRELTHNGGAYMTRHVLNARRRAATSGYLIYKKFPGSPDKIDGAYALVMAWEARLKAVADGHARPTPPRRPRGVVLPS